MTAEQKVDIIVRAAEEVKAEDISQIDLRGKTILADYFLLMNGRSSIQVRAIVDKIVEFMEEAGEREVRLEGYVRGEWVLLDYGDVVVHPHAARGARPPRTGGVLAWCAASGQTGVSDHACRGRGRTPT